MLNITIYMKLNEKIFYSNKTKTSSTVFPKVHGVDKGVDPNLIPSSKQVVKPVRSPVQSYIPSESKIRSMQNQE